ncbi:MAG: acyl CoA:acetate/3-ketoacid CoA transferase, partial [Alphaproteobacteria bacterium]|nr:acyl CoA:acetate/3-ketoacid CoA transferase [Alphaproteobacteria bacterium]
MPKIVSAAEAVKLIADGTTVAVNSSSGLNCPDAVLKALGERFDAESHPRNLTMIHPIAAGDMFGIRGVEHIAKKGLMGRIVAGSYPSGPSSSEPPMIWQLLCANEMPAYNVPSGIMFDMMREAAAKRPGVITKVGLDTFVDPGREGCAMNAKAAAAPIVRKIDFAGEEWLYFPTIVPKVAIIRGSACDERGNLSFEQEGAYLGAMELALA